MGTIERKKRERARREEEIVQKAKELFLSKGYEATTVDEIADALELSKGVIYKHFSSKEELYARVLLDGVEVMYDYFRDAADQETLGLDKFGAIGFAYARFWREHPDFQVLLNQPVLRTKNEDPGPQRRKTLEVFDRIFQLNVTALKQGIEDGSVRKEIDPALAAFIIANSTRGVLEAAEMSEPSLRKMGIEPKDLFVETIRLFGAALQGVQEETRAEPSNKEESKKAKIRKVRK
jgi:AcrR family transcriptional regulator